jgi:hypothetical protein
MPNLNSMFSAIHPAVYRQGPGLLRWVTATPRARGALRYRCPVANSFVLVTDDAELAQLTRPEARLRCAACGDVHLLTHPYDPKAIIADPVES